ncbi:hypothetical protein [Oerskovia sp. Root22]|uniref:hypothetical protein n=1 Tax=Oerskovia sp. Root22 TaxID=1736494 RepID=UPI0006FCEC82|nr:hypothetical protein [Oerskovia sp. Root22]KRC37526.1 hypothetical protein ASE15_05275 [Oerskovia sp. Root22]
MPIAVKRARRTVAFCADLSTQAEYDRATATLTEAQRADGQMLNSSPATRDAAAEVQALEERMKVATIDFEIEAQRRDKWQAFEAAHPPREGDKTDEQFTIDISSLDEVIAQSIVAITDHEGNAVDFDPRTEWAELADEMSDGQWQDFAMAVLAVNRGVKSAPFSQVASRVIRASATD